jgi:pyruvate/2-oxoglutarate/acetoin dehydrogenase E1 component
MLYITAIKKALKDLMDQDPKVILIGEDICDPFGGCFKVTKGLSTKFPERTINTPISEAGIVGLATGLAMEGFKPIVEIMFYDFMTLTLDQLLNHALKFNYLWGISPNITIRTVIGDKSYGVSHCQDLGFIFRHIMPVYRPTLDDDVYGMFMDAVNNPEPTLFVEEKNLYTKKLRD